MRNFMPQLTRSTRANTTRPSARPAVLFALFEDRPPRSSLLRAFALAKLLDADLHVLRVLPAITRVNPLFPQHNVADTTNSMEHALFASRTARGWLRECLQEDDTYTERFSIAHGDFVDQVAEHAAKLEAVLIVVAPTDDQPGSTVTALATEAGVPVLVARHVTTHATIVAATDLESVGYPVLRYAATLARRLDAAVVAVHNVAPVPIVGYNIPWNSSGLSQELLRQIRVERLSQITGALSVDTCPVVRSELTPADAILVEARESDADLVVVGTRKHGWLRAFFASDVAAEIVNRAKRSVLVTPLDAS